MTDKPVVPGTRPYKAGRIHVWPPFAQITYLKGHANYTYLHFTNKSSILVSITLAVVLDRHYPDALRVHKSYAVNPAHVRKVEETTVQVRQVHIPISRRQRRNKALMTQLQPVPALKTGKSV